METIKIRALVAAYGLKRGDEVYVDLTPSTDAMVSAGYWTWLDAPEAAEVTVTEVVKKRAAKKPKIQLDDAPFAEAPVILDEPEIDLAQEFDVWKDDVHEIVLDDFVSVDYTSFPDES